MNTTITTLLENKKILEERILNLQNELITTNKSLTQELYKETVLYDSVLKNSVVDILKMFEKMGYGVTRLQTDHQELRDIFLLQLLMETIS